MRETILQKPARVVNPLHALGETYGLTDADAIMKRALAIAMLASEQADEDGNLHFIRRLGDGSAVEVIVPQRFDTFLPTAQIIPFPGT